MFNLRVYNNRQRKGCMYSSNISLYRIVVLTKSADGYYSGFANKCSCPASKSVISHIIDSEVSNYYNSNSKLQSFKCECKPTNTNYLFESGEIFFDKRSCSPTSQELDINNFLQRMSHSPVLIGHVRTDLSKKHHKNILIWRFPSVFVSVQKQPFIREVS